MFSCMLYALPSTNIASTQIGYRSVIVAPSFHVLLVKHTLQLYLSITCTHWHHMHVVFQLPRSSTSLQSHLLLRDRPYFLSLSLVSIRIYTYKDHSLLISSTQALQWTNPSLCLFLYLYIHTWDCLIAIGEHCLIHIWDWSGLQHCHFYF